MFLTDRPTTPRTVVNGERWRRFRRDGERRHRDELVLAYSPLVKQIAGRMRSRMPSHVDVADLISYGLSGLIDAVERYEPTRGVTFESFATLRIRGAILDELRHLDWVPRAVRSEGRELQRATGALVTRLQRVPDDAELAAELEIDDRELSARLERVTTSHMVALDAPVNAWGPDSDERTLLELLPDGDAHDPGASLDRDELHARASDAVEQLTPREQTILALRYHQDLNFSEIGEVFELTESRICQIHTKSLLQLRALMA